MFIFVILTVMNLAALWSPAGEGLTSSFSYVRSFLVFCHFRIWCPGAGVVLDCLDSCSLHSFLLLLIWSNDPTFD